MAQRDWEATKRIVIEDVINKVRRDFEAAGYGEHELESLKTLWEDNLKAQADPLMGGYSGAPDGGQWAPPYGMGGGGAAVPMTMVGGSMAMPSSGAPTNFGKPNPLMAVKQEPYLNTDDPTGSMLTTQHMLSTNFAPYDYTESPEQQAAKRQRLGDVPQYDGAAECDGPSESSRAAPLPKKTRGRRPVPGGSMVPQLDGDVDILDDSDLGLFDVESGIQPSVQEGQTGVDRGSRTATGRNLDDEDLGSDDDDDDGEPDTNNLILTQFEKVDRVKNKYKCKFKYGVVHINGRNFCFNECKCEFEF